MLEKDFQSKLINTLNDRFKGCIVLKNDSGYKQGIPDLLILYKNKWAALECKRTGSSSIRPNQDYYVTKMDGMSFARFIFPDNEEDVLNELEQAFGD